MAMDNVDGNPDIVWAGDVVLPSSDGDAGRSMPARIRCVDGRIVAEARVPWLVTGWAKLLEVGPETHDVLMAGLFAIAQEHRAGISFRDADLGAAADAVALLGADRFRVMVLGATPSQRDLEWTCAVTVSFTGGRNLCAADVRQALGKAITAAPGMVRALQDAEIGLRWRGEDAFRATTRAEVAEARAAKAEEELQALRLRCGTASTNNHRRVILESPFRASAPEEAARNKRYLLAAIRDCFARGEHPFASHAMYTEALDDADPTERAMGLEAGLAWGDAASEATVVYTDLGVSEGMRMGITRAQQVGRPVEERSLAGWRE